MVVRTPAATTMLLTRAVRKMSSVHRTAEALRSREQTVDEVLRTTVFSPENFPRVLTVSIWVATLEFYGLLGWKYYSRQQHRLPSKGTTALTTHATNTKTLNFVHH